MGSRVLFNSSWSGTHYTPSNELDLLVLLPGPPWWALGIHVLLHLLYTVLGMESRSLCMLGKHCTKGAAAPDPKLFLLINFPEAIWEVWGPDGDPHGYKVHILTGVRRNQMPGGLSKPCGLKLIVSRSLLWLKACLLLNISKSLGLLTWNNANKIPLKSCSNTQAI